MHRKAIIPKGIEDLDFFELARHESEARTRLRLMGMGHLKAGKKQKEIAEFLGVSPETVRQWRIRFCEQGLEGLKEGARSGAPPVLSREKEEEFRQEVESMQKNREGGRVRGKEIQKMLKSQYGCCYSLNGVYVLLKRLGMVWISARSKHPKSDLKSQEAFKKTFLRR